MDVKALYTNTSNNEGIAAVKRKQDNYTRKQKKNRRRKSDNSILSTYFDIKQFHFHSNIYLQIKGYAMGTKCVPTYANIFMAEFEERCIYSLIKNKSSSYLRFLDDIFMVWTKSEYQLKFFTNEINKHHSIKL